MTRVCIILNVRTHPQDCRQATSAHQTKKKECGKLLKSCNDEASQLKEKLQETISERDLLKTKGAKCIDELVACQAGTPSG